MDDNKDALTDVDRALAQALDVTPSANFEARVRQRIASEPAPVPFWSGWRLVESGRTEPTQVGLDVVRASHSTRRGTTRKRRCSVGCR